MAQSPTIGLPIRTKPRSKSTTNLNADETQVVTISLPSRKIELLLDDKLNPNENLDKLKKSTQCLITVSIHHDASHKSVGNMASNNIFSSKSNESQPKRLMDIKLEGTGKQVENARKEIEFIANNNRFMTNDERNNVENSRAKGYSRKVAKLANWELDLSDGYMNDVVKRVSSSRYSDNWAVFKFTDPSINCKNSPKNNGNGNNNNNNNNNKQNVNDNGRHTKCMVIEKHGIDGIDGLAKHLGNINELRYALLHFRYGHIVTKIQNILILWVPRTHLESIAQTVIPIIRHKEAIKRAVRATLMLRIEVHSYLKRSMILSELYSKGLMDEMLLRVFLKTKKREVSSSQSMDINNMNNNNKNNNNNNINKNNIRLKSAMTHADLARSSQYLSPRTLPEIYKVVVVRDWTLKKLKQELADQFDIDYRKIQITHVPFYPDGEIEHSKIFHSPRNPGVILNNDDKGLWQMGLLHGSKIYVTEKEEESGCEVTYSNATLAEDRVQILRNASTPAEFSHHMSHTDLKSRFKLVNRNSESTNDINIQKRRRIKLQKQDSLPSSAAMIAASKQDCKDVKNNSKNNSKRDSVLEADLARSATTKENQISKTIQMLQQKGMKAIQGNSKLQRSRSATLGVTTGISSLGLTDDDSNNSNHGNNGSRKEMRVEIRRKHGNNNNNSVNIMIKDVSSVNSNSVTSNNNGNIYDYGEFASTTSLRSDDSVITATPIISEQNVNDNDYQLKLVDRYLTDRKASIVDIDDGDGTEIKENENKNDAPISGPAMKKQDSLMLPPSITSHVKPNVANETATAQNNSNVNANENKENKEHTSDTEDSESLNDEVVLPFPKSSFEFQYDNNNNGNSNVTQEEEIDLDDIFILNKDVGRGRTAQVHYGLYKDECEVAVKEFKFGRLTEKVMGTFRKELDTLRLLRHPNIALLIGSHIDVKSNQLYLVLEYLPGGCLYDILNDKSIEITFYDVLTMSLDVARGMRYLHDKNIIHRDLKSHNLLLDEQHRVKVTDFGTARHLDLLTGTAFTEVGTGGYMAPEVIEPPIEGYDYKVDIFSFGVLLWEILTRKSVFGEKTLKSVNMMRDGQRPTIPANTNEEFSNLINDCWAFEPKDRPTFPKIVKRLKKIIDKENKTRKSLSIHADADTT